ncbi:MAG: hypothetical protein QXP77_03820, partial [Candidatus Aenigmatarchaeota archaeon]
MDKREKERKAYSLFRQKRVRIEFETDKRIHFKVRGETDEHSVIFDKEKKEFTCDCKFFSLKQKSCSHILACRIFLEKLRKYSFSIPRE